MKLPNIPISKPFLRRIIEIFVIVNLGLPHPNHYSLMNGAQAKGNFPILFIIEITQDTPF